MFAACDRQSRGLILERIFLNQSEGWLRHVIALWKRSDAETRTQIAEHFVPNADLCKGRFDPAIDADSEMVVSLFERLAGVRFSALGDRTQRLLAPSVLETGAKWLPRLIDLALTINGSRSWFLKMLLERHPAATLSPLLAAKIETRGSVSYGDVDALLELPAKDFVAALEAVRGGGATRARRGQLPRVLRGVAAADRPDPHRPRYIPRLGIDHAWTRLYAQAMGFHDRVALSRMIRLGA